MGDLLVYGSEDCLGWQDVRELLETLRDDSRLDLDITVKDPFEHREEFQEKGLVVCPSFLHDGELIAVGTPDFEDLTSSLED